MTKKTTEQFVKQALAVHGDRYDYSLTEYLGARTKLSINCLKHGVFKITADNHLRGKGCKKCADDKKSLLFMSTSDNFITKAEKIHNKLYDYSKVEYRGAKNKVTINCLKHGLFQQTPSDHLSGCGCPKCADEKLSAKFSHTRNDFILRARKVHGEKYDYRSVYYVNSNTDVVIICPEHGLFSQIPYNHLIGKGCLYCTGRNIRDESLIRNELQHRGIRVIKYEKGIDSINGFECDKGHRWKTSLNSVLNNKTGCPTCAFYGFNPGKKGFVYFLLSECGNYLKVGITNKINQRLSQLENKTPFSFTVVNLLKSSGDNVRLIEKYFHENYSSANLKGFDGATEWLHVTPGLLHQVLVTDLLLILS